MRYTSTLTLILLTFLFSQGQLKVPELIGASETEDIIKDSAVKQIVKTSKATIIFRMYSVWSFYNHEYRIISYGNDNKWHYYFTIDNRNVKGFYSSTLVEKTIKKVWNCCTSNNLFSITQEDFINDSCEARIFDSHHYEFIISVGGKYKTISYYAPEFYEKECPGNKNRQHIIKCAKSFLKNCRKE